MDMLLDAFIIAGLSSVALLWVFSVMGALQALWDTFGDHLEGLTETIKEKLGR